MSDPEFLLALTERNVVEQLKNLQTHPAVAARLEQGSLKLHGWVYHIGKGIVTTYNSRPGEILSSAHDQATENKGGAMVGQ